MSKSVKAFGDSLLPTSNLTKDQLLEMIVFASDNLATAHQIVSDTGDYDSAELDKCATLVEQAMANLDIAYRTVYETKDLEYYSRLQMDHLA